MTTDMPIRSEACTVVTLPAEVDLVTSSSVRDNLFATVNRGVVHLVVDARETTFLDSSGVNALVRARERTERLGGSIHVVTQSRPVLRVFSITRLDRVLAVVPTLEVAQRCIAQPQAIHTCGGTGQ